MDKRSPQRRSAALGVLAVVCVVATGCAAWASGSDPCVLVSQSDSSTASPVEKGTLVRYFDPGGSGAVCVKDPSNVNDVTSKIEGAKRARNVQNQTKVEQDAQLQNLTRESEAYRAAYLALLDDNQKNQTVNLLMNILFAILGAALGIVLERVVPRLISWLQ